MRKQLFRIAIFGGSESLCNTLAVLAAKSNGDGKKLSVYDLENVFKAEAILYPTLCENITCSIIGETTLHLDKKKGDEWVNILRIEEVDILELNTIEEITAEEARGLLNEHNFELLN